MVTSSFRKSCHSLALFRRVPRRAFRPEPAFIASATPSCTGVCVSYTCSSVNVCFYMQSCYWSMLHVHDLIQVYTNIYIQVALEVAVVSRMYIVSLLSHSRIIWCNPAWIFLTTEICSLVMTEWCLWDTTVAMVILCCTDAVGGHFLASFL